MKNQSIKKLTNGNIESTATYPEVIVEVTYNGDKHKLGKQPSYNVLNIIEKKNVVHLKLYLEEQYKELEKKYIAFGEAMKPFDGIKDAADKFENSLRLIPKDTTDDHKYAKRLDKTNELSGKITQYIHATKNMVMIKDSMDKIKEQLDFIKENY